jgi:hypothetical protein
MYIGFRRRIPKSLFNPIDGDIQTGTFMTMQIITGVFERGFGGEEG